VVVSRCECHSLCQCWVTANGLICPHVQPSRSDHREAVRQHSPGSRSAPWVTENERKHQTPQGFYREEPPLSQSLVQIYVHVVFSTKQRQSFLKDMEFRDRVHRYLAGIVNNRESPAIVVGGTSDHVHILCCLGKTISISDLVRDMKRDSSKWVKAEQPRLKGFQWQLGYGAFSISPSHVAALKKYIANQEEHHLAESFQGEFRRLCAKYGVAIDERFVWD
jgi:putative transposase